MPGGTGRRKSKMLAIFGLVNDVEMHQNLELIYGRKIIENVDNTEAGNRETGCEPGPDGSAIDCAEYLLLAGRPLAPPCTQRLVEALLGEPGIKGMFR